MKKLTESDLRRIVKQVIKESNEMLLSEDIGQIIRKAWSWVGKNEDEIATLFKTSETALAKSVDDVVLTAMKQKSLEAMDVLQTRLMHSFNPGGLAAEVPVAQQKMIKFLNGYSKSKGRANWGSLRDEVSGTQKVAQKSSQATSQAVNNMMKGQRVSNRWYGWKPENIDFSKFSNRMSFDDLNKSIANAIQTKNWNLVPRAGFEKLGIPNFREYLQNNIAKINEVDPTTGRWSVIFK
jgi:hypothetical protein